MVEDRMVTAGMLADKLRPWALGKATEADAEPGQIVPIEVGADDMPAPFERSHDVIPMLALHPATIGAIYMHLERLAKLDGETTQGQREWSAWDQAIPDGRWHPHQRKDGRYQAIRVTPDGDRKVMAFDHEIEKCDGCSQPKEIEVTFMLECDCRKRCDKLNAEPVA